jgi:hypothetical protein
MHPRNKSKTTLLALGLLAGLLGTASAASEFSYQPYATILSTHVAESGLVDYAGLQANRAQLDTFVQSMARLDPDVLNGWEQGERFAFWMNAYNALTLKAVIDHYPVTSIRDIGSVVKSVWDKLQFNVAGRTLTLNQIEHDILRKEFGDARLHLAINCASIGCPPLGNQPLDKERLDAQFNALTRRFLADPAKFRIERDKGRVHLSSIFKWFGDDFVAAYAAEHSRKNFGEKENGVLNFVARHLNDSDRAYLANGDFKIRYLDYDWDLNQQ